MGAPFGTTAGAGDGLASVLFTVIDAKLVVTLPGVGDGDGLGLTDGDGVGDGVGLGLTAGLGDTLGLGVGHGVGDAVTTLRFEPVADTFVASNTAAIKAVADAANSVFIYLDHLL